MEFWAWGLDTSSWFLKFLVWGGHGTAEQVEELYHENKKPSGTVCTMLFILIPTSPQSSVPFFTVPISFSLMSSRCLLIKRSWRSLYIRIEIRWRLYSQGRQVSGFTVYIIAPLMSYYILKTNDCCLFKMIPSFLTDSTMVNHHFSPPCWGRCAYFPSTSYQRGMTWILLTIHGMVMGKPP